MVTNKTGLSAVLLLGVALLLSAALGGCHYMMTDISQDENGTLYTESYVRVPWDTVCNGLCESRAHEIMNEELQKRGNAGN